MVIDVKRAAARVRIMRLDPWKLRCARAMRGVSLVELMVLAGFKPSRRVKFSQMENYQFRPDAWARLYGDQPQTYPAGVASNVVEPIARALGVAPLDLCSDDRALAESRAEFDEWVKYGRCELTTWLRQRFGVVE